MPPSEQPHPRPRTPRPDAPALATALVLLAAAGAALAQSTGPEARSLEEVVVEGRPTRYSATKSDTPILETARSVSIEDRGQLIEKGALNLADAFVYSAGVTGESYGFATRGDWVFVRGLDVPDYRDSLQALFGNYNNTRPDIYTIKQVEILKGPASVLYGQGSPGGIVNVVSKTPQEESASEFVLEYGNYERVEAAVDVTGAIDADARWLYRLIGVYRDTGTQIARAPTSSRAGSRTRCCSAHSIRTSRPRTIRLMPTRSVTTRPRAALIPFSATGTGSTSSSPDTGACRPIRSWTPTSPIRRPRIRRTRASISATSSASRAGA